MFVFIVQCVLLCVCCVFRMTMILKTRLRHRDDDLDEVIARRLAPTPERRSESEISRSVLCRSDFTLTFSTCALVLLHDDLDLMSPARRWCCRTVTHLSPVNRQTTTTMMTIRRTTAAAHRQSGAVPGWYISQSIDQSV